MKRLFALLLALVMTVSLGGTVALATNDPASDAADQLYDLELFKGSGTDENGDPIYDLDRAPNRYEAVTMLVRLLGKEQEALAGTWDVPFTDVASWAKPYVGYAYTHGLTSGVSETAFGGTQKINATQYLTFILRALGYDSSKDFKWNAAWELSDKLGLTSGQYNKQTNADFLRGDVALISRDALYACIKGTTTKLLDAIGVKETQPVYEVDYSGDVPVETGDRNLSDAELETLAGKTPEQAASAIETLADAYAWLKQEGYATHGADLGGNGTGEWFKLSNDRRRKELSWSEMSTTLNVLLDDDYDEVGTLMCTLVADEDGWPFYYISFNYVKTGGYYYVTDPVCHVNNTGLPFCRAYTIKADSLGVVVDALFEINAGFAPITIATYPLHTGEIAATLSQNPISVLFDSVPGVRYLFRADSDDLVRYKEEKEQAEANEMKAWKTTARGIKIPRYNMPAAIGNTTLNYDSAALLVGEDPEKIAESIKTVADVLQYMIAARFGYYSDYFGTPWYDYWGFDAPGDYQISENYGCCCGGYANAVSFLLQGDYEKVGTLRWVGGGNHTISWVYTGGKYYVFDFTQYCSGGNYNNYDCPVTVLNRLEDFYDHMPDTYSYFPKSEVVIMVAFEAGAAMYPSHWQDPPNFTGLTFPKEAEGNITVIYQKDPRYGVEFKTVNTVIPGWGSDE